MGSDLEDLQSIAEDPHLSKLLETMIIHDDCENLDPWATRLLPTIGHPYMIWPRDETGRLISSGTGIASLAQMLRTRQLRPNMIKIRDYCINNSNLPSDTEHPEIIYARDLVRAREPHLTTPCSVLTMATDLARDANVSIISFATEHVDWPMGELPSELDTPYTLHSRLYHGRMIAHSYVNSLASPSVTEATMVLSTEYEGPETDFSSLDSVDLRLDQKDETDYWLEQIFYKAPALRTLKLSFSSSDIPSLTASMVVPRLANLELSRLSTSAEQILAMLARSRETLTQLSLRSISLDQGSTWNELLALIAKEFTSLTSFNMSFLSQPGLGKIDFHKAPDHIPQEVKVGLRFREKAAEKRVTSIAYDGPNAAEVLGVLSRLGYLQNWAQIEERRARAIAAESSEVSSTT
jgi:hypothetical protein